MLCRLTLDDKGFELIHCLVPYLYAMRLKASQMTVGTISWLIEANISESDLR